MSWLPMYKAWVLMVGVVSLFLWKLLGVFIFFIVGIYSLFLLAKDSLGITKHYASGFWMFIVSEVVAFGSLFYICSMKEDPDVLPLSNCLELPLLGCFILTGSSMTMTTYHHFLGSVYSQPFLLLTIVLGLCFISLQLFELYDCNCDLTFCLYEAVCLCTVGLHFLHVLGGVTVMAVMYSLGEGVVPRSNMDFIVWYWHFVDYVWLFVYLMIYLP